MKPKYEISVWDDVLSADGTSFTEKKIIVIGSDTMTSEARARDPKLVENINGTNKFTFNMYYSYIDTRTGERVKNPYIQYLINERKIKVNWKDKWYDLIIKQIKEDQVQHLFSYTCEDVYITELSRTGFELTFATELENNIGTAQELVEKVIENTDWRFDAKGSQSIYQETEEPVYDIQVADLQGLVYGVKAKCEPNGEEIYIQGQDHILLYYSYAPNINNIDTTKAVDIQFYYNNNKGWEQDENDMLVINGQCCTTTIKWKLDPNDDNIAIATIGGGDIFFTVNFGIGVSKQYRAKRYVQSQKTIYNSIVDRYVNIYTYNGKELLGYNTTQFDDALAVVNLFTNPSNFKNTSGWIGDNLSWKLYPPFDSTTEVSSYTTTSYLQLKGPQFIYNTGIQNNRAYIPDGFIQGETYILRIKAKSSLSNEKYISDSRVFVPSVSRRLPNEYIPLGNDPYFTSRINRASEDDGLEYIMTCVKSCPADKILSSSEPFGLFLNVVSNQTYWLEEIQFYKEIWGEDGEGNLVRINPGEMNIQSVSQQYWKYFYAEQPDGTTKDNLIYEHISKGEWVEAVPVNNQYQRYGTIEADNSNRFNILQSIAETFECWIRFEIEHDDKGYIKYDEEGLPKKWVRIMRETGQETGIGFIYGIDLKGIVRNIKSDKISTKTIVEQNENEFGTNGFCSIARSSWNYPKENFIYNFDYYIQHGLLDRDVLYDDLYNIGGYYTWLNYYNTQYAQNLESLINKKTELTKQNAMMTVYSQYISSTQEEINSVLDSLFKLSGVDPSDDEAEQKVSEYARTHINDVKVATLLNDKAQLEITLDNYINLATQLQLSLDSLNIYIEQKTIQQKQIITELTRLNRNFYVKYARFIQEGTWTSEDYWNDDLYYLDALQVAYQSSRPQISYDINVLRLSDIEEYSSKIFNLGDISFVQDTEYFGYKDDKITPYKEQVILTEITSCFDTPDKDIIKVQNYKNQFDDLFQRITATVQNLEFTKGKYAKAANIVTSDGTIRSSVIQNTFNENKDLVYGAQNESATIDNTGITVTDNANAAKQVKITSGGVFVTDDGGDTWKNAIRGDGISADVVTTGKLNTELISIYGANAPSFTWDAYGINAYMLDEGGHVATYTVDTTVTAETFSQNTYYKKINDEYVIADSYEPGVTYYLQTDYESQYQQVDGITKDNFISNYYYIKNSEGQYIIATTFNEGDIYYTATRSTQQSQYVRFDKYGIYGIKNKLNYRPVSESQIYQDASFGLTWNKFFMKSVNGNKSIEISTDKDIVVNDGNTDRIVIGRVDGADYSNYGIRINRWNSEANPPRSETIFECSDQGSTIAGWTITRDSLSSKLDSSNKTNIQIRADGNIGCYGHPSMTDTEDAYLTSALTGSNIPIVSIQNPNSTTVLSGDFYVYVNQIGSRAISYLREQTTTANMAWQTQYNPQTRTNVKISITKINGSTYQYYERDSVTIKSVYVSYSRGQTPVREYDKLSSDGKTVEHIYVYQYTGLFNYELTYANKQFCTVNTTNTYNINFYIPASNTKWSIDRNGQAVFHDIYADYGKIAGWFINSDRIYQTYDGTPNLTRRSGSQTISNIKQQLSTIGSQTNPADYSFVTDAINSAIASIAGMTFKNGLIDGYSLANLYAIASNAASTASSALSTASAAQTTAGEAKAAAASAALDAVRALQYAQQLAGTVNWMIEHWPSS